MNPSNDSGCDDDILLAAMIQSAKSHNLRPCRGRYFVGNTHCCAMGAALLSGSIIAGMAYGRTDAIAAGNDGREPPPDADCRYLSGYSIGMAFQDAMSPR